jgi:ribonuclease E
VTPLLEAVGAIERWAAKTVRPRAAVPRARLAVRVIREEFNADYRGVVIDDEASTTRSATTCCINRRRSPTASSSTTAGPSRLSLFERHHVHEQLHKALDRKVWLPSGGSLIIEHTEALTVIDVNTGKNVGSSSLEETVFRNNLEAAEEIAKQLRLRDIGGIIVIDFIDMEIKDNRDEVIAAFRDALAATRPAPRCSTSPSSAWSR